MIRVAVNKLNNKTIKNIFIYSFGVIILKGINFFLLPLYTSVLTPAQYGQLELINTFTSILIELATLGLTSVVFVEYFNLKNFGRKAMMSDLLLIYFILSIPIFLIAIGLSLQFNTAFFGEGLSYSLVIIGIVYAYLIFFQSLFFSYLRISEKAIKLTFNQVSFALGVICLNILFVYYLRFGIKGILLSNLIMISAWLCYGFFEYKKLIIHFNIKRAVHHIKYYLKIGLPFVPSALASWVIIWSNRWIILYYLNENEVGIYSIASKFGTVYEALILTPIITAIVPSILKRFSEKQYDLYKRYVLLSGVVFFVFIGFCLKFLAKFVINPTFHEALPLIFFFSIPYCLQFLSYYLNIPLLFNKNTLYTSMAFIVASIVTVAANITLVPIYHLYGGILGNACGYFVFFVIIFIKSNRVVSILKARL